MRRLLSRWTAPTVVLAVGLALAVPPAWAGDRGPVEICTNDVDDDLDGLTDEQQCQLSPDGAPTSASGVVPETWNDNPNCSQMGFGFGFKTDGCATGRYYFVAGSGSLTGGAPPDPNAFVDIECVVVGGQAEARLVNWSTNLALDAVFVKGGPTGGNLYVYHPEAAGDSGLGTPGTGSGISHVEYCYDYELDVTKTVEGRFDRVYTWTIQKDDDGTYDTNIGDPATNHGYQVTVDQTVTDQSFAVTGEIVIQNNSPFAATIAGVTDLLDDGTAAVVDCAVTFPSTLAAGADLTCTYVALPAGANATLNTATVTTSGTVGGEEATAPVSFTATTVGYPTVNVTDTNGQAWSASGDATWTYGRDFACSTNPDDYSNGRDSYSHVNTATIVETGDFDIATVTVNCYAPVVTKTADATLTRTWDWDIAKGPDGTYSDFIGDPATTHEYDITVTRVGSEDSGWGVTGSISVDNFGPLPMALSAVTDIVGAASANVSCPGLVVTGGSTLTCTYVAGDGLDGTETQNVATATFNGIAFNGYAPVRYVPTEVNASVNVTDTADGEPAQAFGPFTETTSFSYSKPFQCPASPGAYTNGVNSSTRVNTATITETGDSDTATVVLTCYAPLVTKDATATYDERHEWSVEKTVDPSSQNAFVGEEVDYDWTVTVNETSSDENWRVIGTITVTNPHPTEAMLLDSVVDSVNGIAATVSCSSLSVPASGQLTCPYEASAGLDGDESANTATATFNGIGFSFVRDFTYQLGNVIGDNAVLTDQQGPLNEVLGDCESSPCVFTYDDGYTCSVVPSHYTVDGTYSFADANIATVTADTTIQATATSRVYCYAPLTSKTAATSYSREFTWSITKSADPTAHAGFPGDAFQSDYDVAVDQTMDEYGFGVSGTITVVNPRPDAAMTVSVSDLVGGSPATLGCGGTLLVPAGSSADCAYSANLASKTDGTNTATVTLNSVGFTASRNYAFGDPDEVLGHETVNVTDTQPDSTAPWTASGDATWSYAGHFDCPTDTGLYVNGVYTFSVPNRAQITETGQFADQEVDVTCLLPAMARVVKTVTDGDEDIGQLPFEFGLFEPGADTSDLGNAVETGTLNGAGEVSFLTELEAEGTWTVVELLPEGWVSDSDLNCEFVVDYPASAGQSYTCSFDNVEMSRLDLLKLTDGIVHPTMVWSFALFAGPDGFGPDPLATQSTPTDPADAGVLKFGNVNLDPGSTYTVCELDVPAGHSAVWAIDTNDNGSIDNEDIILVPYNPNEDDPTPEDVGNRCVDVGADTNIPLASGTTLHLIVDNSYPGGNPRTPGYWKNWNRCTGGGQQYTADANGGYEEGFWLLEDVLDPAIGGGITWDDILPPEPRDPFVFPITTCAVAVDILDKRLVADPTLVGDGRKMASDPLVNLAAHLLAAQLNFGAGACTAQEVLDAALDAERLLDKYNYYGQAAGLVPKKSPDVALANGLAAVLDAYNNGAYCGDFVN